MIAIVTDSSAHLYRDEADEMGVTVVPMTYSLSGQQPFTESYMDENGDFERLFDGNMERLRTSQASFSSFLNVFRQLIDSGADVLCLTISSRLSGTFGNAGMAAREFPPERIQVVDSLTTSGGLYLMVREARRLLDGGAGLRETAAALNDLRHRVNITFTVDDIAPLRRSGRLGGVRLSISTILNIRPVLRCIDGSIVATGVVRGRSDQLNTLARSLPKGGGDCIVEGFLADEQVQALKKRVEALGYEAMARRVGPVLGIHLGRGCLGVCWIAAKAQGGSAKVKSDV
jgi:DegV family protein with EDD domain